MDVRLRVLKESNKRRFHSCSVRDRVMIISHIAFRNCRVHILSDKPFSKQLYQNICIVLALTLRARFAGKDALSIPLRFLFFFVTVGPEYESVMALSTHNVEATGWKTGEDINDGTILFSLARLLTLVEPLKTNLKTNLKTW